MANEIHTYVITTANIWLLTGHEKWYWKDFSSMFPLKTAQAALACINLLGKLLHTTKLEWGVLLGMGNVSLDVKLENVFLNKFEPLSCHISSWCFIFSPWTTHIPAGSQFHSLTQSGDNGVIGILFPLGLHLWLSWWWSRTSQTPSCGDADPRVGGCGTWNPGCVCSQK